jgi:hypothetical protein
MFYHAISELKNMKLLKGSGQGPAIVWVDRMWSDRGERMRKLRVLARFSRFCHRSPAELLRMSDRTAMKWLERWIDSLKAARSTKLNYISTVRGYFAFHRRPLPKYFPV